MAVIDVGSAATDRASYKLNGYTWISYDNTANDTGTLDTFEVFAVSGYGLSGFKAGTFSGSSATFTNRDYESIGNVTAGSKQTFGGLNCDVTSGDKIGCYYSGGRIEGITSGGGNLASKVADTFGAGEVTEYGIASGDSISLYATGATVAAGSLPLKNVFGRPFSGVFR